MIVRSQDVYSDTLRFSTWASVIAHGIALWFFTYYAALIKIDPPEPGIVVEVSYLPPPKILKEPSLRIPPRIVAPSDTTESLPPENARYLSDKNSRTEKEQIKRGDLPDAGAAVGKGSAPTAPQPARSRDTVASGSPPKTRVDEEKTTSAPASKKDISALKLDSKTLSEKFGELPKKSSDETLREVLATGSSGEGSANLSAVAPFSRNPGSGARFLGLQGNPDYLPYLPDGDLTLLNAKANLFAVFVRRVALQVFSQLRSSGWEYLRSGDIRSIETESTVRAVLSPKGDLLKVELEKSSGSSRFDQVLLSSVKLGAKDPNPPKEAAAKDGNIHFIFKSRSWVRSAADPRSPTPFEQRWLMLGTGLD